MKKFVTTYKWICLPVILSSAAVISTSTFAVPTTSQQYQDAQQTSRMSQQFVGGNTQLGAGITDQGNVDVELNQVLSESNDRSTSGGIWAEYDIKGDDKGFQGRGVEINHNWLTRDGSGQARRVNKAKAAYDRNASGHDKVTLGYGQETEHLFWEGRVSKGLSGRKNTRSDGDNTISDRAYEYGVGASIGKFLPNSNLRVRGGLDHEWSDKVGAGEKDATNTTLSAGLDKYFEATGHSISLDVSGSDRSGGYRDGASSDKDYSARLGYKYDFAGSRAFQNATSKRRIRVEVPGNTVAPRYEARTQYKKVPTFKTVPIYAKKTVKVPYKRMVKSTMGLEGQTFFKYGSSKLIPSAQKRLAEIAHEIRRTGYKGSIRITGNTCGLKNERNDRILSKRRADTVKSFLIKQGFNPDHMLARGLGKGHTKYKHIPGGGFKNRRVDIEYVAEVNTAKIVHRTEHKTVQTGTRKVATGFKNIAAGTKNVMIDNGRAGSPRVIWKTEIINNPPAWIKRGLHNNIKHDRSINTYQTTEGFDNLPLNDQPVATDDNVKTECGIPLTIDVLGNDSDVNGNQLSVLSFTQGTNGSVTKGANGQLIYTPNSNGCGLDDKFNYTISDGNGGTDTATVTVSVDPDDVVIAENETTTVQAGEQITIDVLNNDDADASIRAIVVEPRNGTAKIVSGQIVYIANPGFSGIDTLTYEVVDANGNFDTAVVTINVAGPNNTAPVANNDEATTLAGQSVNLDSLANDTDAENDTLTIKSVANPSNGTAVVSGGQITYTPDAGFTGTDTFTYVISDGNGGTAEATETVIVTAPSTQAPVATNDLGNVVCSGPVTINVLENDNDADTNLNNLSILEFTQPNNGTVTKSGNGQLIYTSNGNSCGTNDQFTYNITDGVNSSNTATVTISIAPAVANNNSPTAEDDAASTQVNKPVTIMTVANDTDPDGDDLTITNVTQPQSGTVTNDGKKITYTPNQGFVGVDIFDYTITDGNGGTSMATETVTVTAAPNTKPVANDDSVTTTEGTPVTFNTVANDTDADGDNLTITNVQQPQNGSVTNDGKKITYTPRAGFIGIDKFTYTITDGNGGNATATETVLVEAVPNKAPIANLDIMSTGCAIITIDALANDTDPENDTLNIVSVSGASLGTAAVVGNKIEFKPSNTCDKGGTGLDSLSYTISDGQNTSTGKINIDVQGDEGNTRAESDSVTTEVNTPIDINVLANDSGIGVRITMVDNPINGSVTFANGVITYTPDQGFVGTDDFYYDIIDQNGYKDAAMVIVNVEAACPVGQKCN